MCLRHKHIILSLALLLVACSPIGAQVSIFPKSLSDSCFSVSRVDTVGHSGTTATFRISQHDRALYHLWAVNDSSLSYLGNSTDTLLRTVSLGDTDTVFLFSLHLLNEELSRNIVPNGDLEQGFVGFAVDHRFTFHPTPNDSALLDPGHFAVDTNPRYYRARTYPDAVHDGKMLMVHSLPRDNSYHPVDSLFAVTLRNIDTDGYYLVGFEAATLVSPSPVITLGMRLVGDTTFSLNLTDSLFCWRQDSWLWHPRGTDTVSLTIVNPNPNPEPHNAHNLAIDNIEMRQLCVARDTARITVRDSIAPSVTVHLNGCQNTKKQARLPLTHKNHDFTVDTAKRHDTYVDKAVAFRQTTDAYGTLYSYIFIYDTLHVIFDTINFPVYDTVSDTIFHIRELFDDSVTVDDSIYLANNNWVRGFADAIKNTYLTEYTMDLTFSGEGDQCDTHIHCRLVVPWNCDCNLQFPTLVTPNGDGYNDCFGITNLTKSKEEQGLCYENNTLSIYNRWGKLVYHKKNINLEEDFWCPSDNMPEGTYFYYFAAHSFYDYTTDNYLYMVRRHGTFELIRSKLKGKE